MPASRPYGHTRLSGRARARVLNFFDITSNDMMEKILLINGLIFTYLLFSKKLSSEKKENRKKVKYIGIAVFLIFFIALSSFYFLDNYQMIEIITWGAIIVSSAAILFRIFQLKKEN